MSVVPVDRAIPLIVAREFGSDSIQVLACSDSSSVWPILYCVEDVHAYQDIYQEYSTGGPVIRHINLHLLQRCRGVQT